MAKNNKNLSQLVAELEAANVKLNQELANREKLILQLGADNTKLLEEVKHNKDLVDKLYTQIFELKIELNKANEPSNEPVPVVNKPPLEVWVSGKDLGGGKVEWGVHLSEAQPKDIEIGVYHTDPKEGTEHNYTWVIPANKNYHSGIYTYNPETVSNPLFKVNPSFNYSLVKTDDKPAAVIVYIKPLPVPTPETKPVVVVKEQLEPLTITAGQVISNKVIRSAVSTKTAVQLRTDQEVIFDNCTFEVAGLGIENHAGGTNLKVINCKFKGLPHTGATKDFPDPRRALSVNGITNLHIENCESDDIGFLTTQGAFRGNEYQGIAVVKCDIRNISGLMQNGRKHANFVQIMNSGVNGIPNVNIIYNSVTNVWGLCDVEDNINIYNARGRKGNPMHIHSNLINGGFYHPTQRQKYYSGSAVMIDGNGGDGIGADGKYDAKLDTCPKYIEVFDNVFVNNGNCGMGMAAGQNITFRNNKVITAAILPDGKPFHSVKFNDGKTLHSSGIWAAPLYKAEGAAVMQNNIIAGNTIGANYYDRRQDVSVMQGADFRNNTFYKEGQKLTNADEQLFIDEWNSKYAKEIGVK